MVSNVLDVHPGTVGKMIQAHKEMWPWNWATSWLSSRMVPFKKWAKLHPWVTRNTILMYFTGIGKDVFMLFDGLWLRFHGSMMSIRLLNAHSELKPFLLTKLLLQKIWKLGDTLRVFQHVSLNKCIPACFFFANGISTGGLDSWHPLMKGIVTCRES